MPFYSPLRYPGGKRKLSNFVAALLIENDFTKHAYVEPYAGGAAVALHLLLENHVAEVWINDFDHRIAAFWRAVTDHSDELCRRISKTAVDVDEWRRQRTVYVSGRGGVVDVAFATLFLNRTNRSGVLLGGLIGGKEQQGKWKMACRFNRRNLISRIEAIAAQRDRVRVTCMDAAQLLLSVGSLEGESFLFLDPPYFHKTDRRLYMNEYSPEDHERIASILLEIEEPWLLTYDDCKEVRQLYRATKGVSYTLSYTAGRKRRGREVLFVSPGQRLPAVDNPERVARNVVEGLRGGFG